MQTRRFGNERGHALLEFTALLPLFIMILVGLVDISVLLSRQITISHLSRETASFVARGAEMSDALTALLSSDGSLDLDGPDGRVIVTRVSRDTNGVPMIVEQQIIGGLGASSVIGRLPGNARETPAALPNGVDVPVGTHIAFVEIYSRQSLLGNQQLSRTLPSLVISSMGAF